MSLEEIRNKLIDLYLCVKVRKSDEIKNITSEYIQNERNSLKKIPLIDIINYIQNSIEILVEMRAIEKYEEKLEKDEEKNNYINKEDPNDANGLKLYEGMLINAEKRIRNHIRVSIYKYNKYIYIQNEQELKLIIDELESQIDDINNGSNENNKNKKIIDTDYDNKNKFFHPNNSGLINHLKKENERLRKLVISYEFKNKKYNNINNIYNADNNNNSNFLINKFYFEIIRKKKDLNLKETYINNNINNTYHNTNKNKREMKINKDYKFNFSNRSIGTIKKIKNNSKIIKKPEIKKIKEINMFDNDYNYIKEKENPLQRYTDFKLYNSTQKDRTTSLSQRKRKIINAVNNSMNQNTLRGRNIVKVNNKIINNNNVIERYNNLSSSRSLSKIIKRKKINDYSFNNSIKIEKKTIGVINNLERQLNSIKMPNNKIKIIKTIENKKNDNSSLEKDYYNSSTSRQKHIQMIKKKNKNNELKKKVYYQKPIINKITIYNNINNEYNNNNNSKQKIQLNEQTGKLIFEKKNFYKNNFNNYTLGI